MNRIQLPSWKQGSPKTNSNHNSPTDADQLAQFASPTGASASSPDLASSLDEAQAALACEASRLSSAYSLFGPLHYEPQYAYPLVVWLHDAGGDERQLQQIMPLVSLQNYVAVAVRGTCQAHDDLPTYHWGNSAAAIVRAENAVFAGLQTARERFHVNPDKIFVAGCGAGGTMALRVALRNPELFAGVASLGGRFPRGHRPLVAWSRLPGLKILLAHGRDARDYSVDHLCDDLKLFHAARLSVAIRQYPAGDELRTPMFQDLNRWMMEIVTGQPSSAPTVEARPEVGAN